MSDSTYVWDDTLIGRIADGEQSDGTPVPITHFDSAYSAFSLYTTAPDFARFMLAMLNPDDPIVRQMIEPQVKVGHQVGLWWGLGWGIQQPEDDILSCWHWGANRGYRNFALFYPDSKCGAVILTNSARGTALARDVLALIGMGAQHPAFDWLLNDDWRSDGRTMPDNTDSI
jgi:CubicO group peptidase (beta-lactamase class C family)